MQIKPDEITSILKSRIENLDAGQADLTEVGTVLSVADGIARIHGLENAMSFEMLELPHDVTGLALNLESDNVGAVLFGPWGHVKEGDTVKRTNRLLPVEVTSAVELDTKTVQGIGDRIAEQTGRKVELSSAVEPDILGGIVVRVGNQVLDASIRNRLDTLRKQVVRS